MGGWLFGGGRSNKRQPAESSLRIQTSIQGRPRAIGAGQNRLAGNVIWYGDFAAHAQKNKTGGKGGGGATGKGSSGSYTYTASFLISVAEGPISAIQTIFNGNAIDFLSTPSAGTLADLAAIGVTPTYGNTYGATFLLGGYSQSAWSYLATAHPDKALNYRGEACVGFPNFGLGSSTTVPSFGFEIKWGMNTSAGCPDSDVNPADWISAFLTDEDWGVQGFPSALLGDLATYRTFCRAYGLWISPLLTEQTAAQSHLQDLMKATSSDFLWSGGKLSIVPLVDGDATGNGVTFTAPVTPVYDIVDFLPYDGGELESGTAVQINRRNPSDVKNSISIEFADRGALYNLAFVSYADDAHIRLSGAERPADKRTQHFFCTRAAAGASAPLQLQRERIATEYRFTLPPQYVLLEPFDIVTLTVPALGLVRKAVRILEIEERSDFSLNFVAEEFFGAVGAAQFAVQAQLGTGVNANADPLGINTPVIFEPPDVLATRQVWFGASGIDPAKWGGANVWISTDDGSTYTLLPDQITGPARHGVTTASLPSVTLNPSGQTVDNTNTLHLDMSLSGGELASGSSAEMSALTTLCYVGGELIAYQNATLTSANHYDLAPMVRGAYGSAISSHSSGAQFLRLDTAVFKYSYDPGLIGKAIKIKIQSFNVYGGGAQDISTLTPIDYTIAGSTPARVDHYNSIALPTGGQTITFQPDSGTYPVAFTGGPNGAALPYVTVTWSVTAGDTLFVTALSTSSVNIQIKNGGVGVARTVNVVAQGY